MKKILLASFVVLVMALNLSAQSQATGERKSPLEVKLNAWIIRTDTVDGKPVVRRLPADSVMVGDTIEYELIYKNVSDFPITGLKPTALIPPNTSYVPGSAGSDVKARVYFSIDGGKTFHEPPIYHTVTLPDGRKVKKEATPDMFTNIRWGMKGELHPGRTARFYYKVVVK